MTLPPPAWFTSALAAPAADGSVEVEGARIRYRAWGDRGARGAVLVHGTAAHARWWDHVAPQLPAGMRVVALDLSGHGDSDRRSQYSLDRWAAEVVAVAADGGISGEPFIVGHSLGGNIAIRAAALYGAALAGIVVIDTPLFETPPPAQDTVMGTAAFGVDRTYQSREEALARFRLVPEHPVLPYVRDHIAAWSVTRRDSGEWGWKFDRSLFPKMERSWPVARRADCRAAVLRAQHGIMTPLMADLLCERLGRDVTVFEIPAAGHHVLLDEPLCLVTALRAVLAGWGAPGAARAPGAPLLSGASDA
jgi:pimeloyl-ACP methyl ester carboxylesterase